MHSRLFSTIIELMPGELLCAYRRASAMYAEDGRTYLLRSTDSGASWVDEGVVWGGAADAKPYSYSATFLSKMSDGWSLTWQRAEIAPCPRVIGLVARQRKRLGGGCADLTSASGVLYWCVSLVICLDSRRLDVKKLIAGIVASAVLLGGTAAWAGQGCSGGGRHGGNEAAKTSAAQGFSLTLHKAEVLLAEPLFAVVSLEEPAAAAAGKPTDAQIWAKINGHSDRPRGHGAHFGRRDTYRALTFEITPAVDRHEFAGWHTAGGGAAGCPLSAGKGKQTADGRSCGGIAKAAGCGKVAAADGANGCCGQCPKASKAAAAAKVAGCDLRADCPKSGKCDPSECPVGCNKAGTVSIALSDRFKLDKPGKYTITAYLRTRGGRIASNAVSVTVKAPTSESDKAALARLAGVRWASFATGEGCSKSLNLMAQWPDSTYAPYAQYYRGRHLQSKGDSAGAAQAYRDVIKRHPGSFIAGNAALALAKCEIKTRDYVAAGQRLRQLIANRDAGHLHVEARNALSELPEAKTEKVGPQARVGS